VEGVSFTAAELALLKRFIAEKAQFYVSYLKAI
jgi:hypothetical protein